MPNYNNGKIYKITGGGMTYFGSTTLSCSRRFSHHKCTYKRFKNGEEFHPTKSYQILDFDDCIITLLEDFPCERKEQLLARERFYIENYTCVNKVIPGRTLPEYYIDNKEKISQQQKIWATNNKEHIREHVKEYNKQNTEKIAKTHADYYILNKEKHLGNARIKFNCQCGSILRVGDKSTHNKSIKHQTYINSIEVNPEIL